MTRPTAIDLFAGCGGMSLGLEAAGFDIVAAVDGDPIHTLVHHYNFPYSLSICQNIQDLNSEKLLAAIAARGYSTEIDLIAGGPPCQGFSLSGKRKLDDPRNSLLFEYLRLVKEIKPKYFLLENVPGLNYGKYKSLLAELLTQFAQIGYMITQPIQILDACCYGAPQKRKRLILCGSRFELQPLQYPQPSHGKQRPLVTCGEAIADLSQQPIYLGEDPGIDVNLLDYSGYRESYYIKPSGEFALCHSRSLTNRVYGHLGSRHQQQTQQRFNATSPGQIEPTSRFFKLDYQGQCHTLRAGTTRDRGGYTAPRPIHYAHPRCITIREAARLHTFPDWFRFHQTIWHGFREIGNAVVPVLAKALGQEVIRALQRETELFPTRSFESPPAELLSFNGKQIVSIFNNKILNYL